MHITRFLIAGVTAALIAVPFASAQDKGCPYKDKGIDGKKNDYSYEKGDRGNQGKGFWKDLSLTAEQKSKLILLRDERKTFMQEHAGKIKAVRLQIKSELLSQTTSRSVLDKYLKEMAELHKEFEAKLIEHLLKVKAILTPEQFSKLVTWEMERHPGKGEGPRPGRPDGPRHRDGE